LKPKDSSLIKSESSFDDSSLKSLSFSDLDLNDIDFENGFSS